MLSKRYRREATAYAICGLISASVFGASYGLERSDVGLCTLMHPGDSVAQADCRASTVVENPRD